MSSPSHDQKQDEERLGIFHLFVDKLHMCIPMNMCRLPMPSLHHDPTSHLHSFLPFRISEKVFGIRAQILQQEPKEGTIDFNSIGLDKNAFKILK